MQDGTGWLTPLCISPWFSYESVLILKHRCHTTGKTRNVLHPFRKNCGLVVQSRLFIQSKYACVFFSCLLQLLVCAKEESFMTSIMAQDNQHFTKRIMLCLYVRFLMHLCIRLGVCIWLDEMSVWQLWVWTSTNAVPMQEWNFVITLHVVENAKAITAYMFCGTAWCAFWKAESPFVLTGMPVLG